MASKLSLFIIHPSRVFRSALEETLGAEDDLDVTGSAMNVKTGLRLMAARIPDVVLADVESGDMTDLLQGVADLDPGGVLDVGVVVIAPRKKRRAEETIRALEAGAFDFVVRHEDADRAEAIDSLCRQLRVKLRHFSSTRIIRGVTAQAVPVPDVIGGRKQTKRVPFKVVVIGSSTGGPMALSNLLPALGPGLDVPVVVAQHMPSEFTSSLARSLDAKCPWYHVAEARDGEVLQSGRVYVAPGGTHIRLDRDSRRMPVTRISRTPPVDGNRPCVDMLFKSAADVYGAKVAALILTGMGRDGSKGLTELKRVGATVLAQDKKTSVVWGMPGSAVATGLVDMVMTAPEMARYLTEHQAGEADGD